MDMSVEQAYELAKERYAAFGIDTDAAIDKALELPIALHCWQADLKGATNWSRTCSSNATTVIRC